MNNKPDRVLAEGDQPVAEASAVGVNPPSRTEYVKALVQSNREDIAAALEVFIEAHRVLRDAVGARLDNAERYTVGGRRLAVDPRREAAVPKVIELVRRHPELSPTTDPDSMQEGVDFTKKMKTLAMSLESFTRIVNKLIAVEHIESWDLAKLPYGVAGAKAKDSFDMRDQLAPIRAILKNGARERSTETRASAAKQRADNARARAAKATYLANKAAKANARAAGFASRRRLGGGLPDDNGGSGNTGG